MTINVKSSKHKPAMLVVNSMMENADPEWVWPDGIFSYTIQENSKKEGGCPYIMRYILVITPSLIKILAKD